ncbi:CDP-diacylglycerol--inositol 3-phosphatidyltransferase-like [Oppia nitens]|uniref:CDP-diacylglycerol--inositol 3-phosphatidyltransferase-like n=1 Tax=Oppia nitens TaxID=1686743 RepID=UPI0023D97F40|nr:CDP-diacylglycerol--inositol 3-phosphatidyltransferase-like [Oppia nitens]
MSENIFLFVPNLIGFARIVLALVSFALMVDHYLLATCFYVTSALLDAFDGMAARRYNQSTRFGAMLDQLTDRCATMALIQVLTVFYPKYMFLFQLSLIIDISCHWIHLQTSTMLGKTSHKTISLDENPVMRLYYTNRSVLFFMCAGNELFYSALYFLHFTSGPLIPYLNISIVPLLVWVSAPIALIKTGISLLHGVMAAMNLANLDLIERQEQGISPKKDN